MCGILARNPSESTSRIAKKAVECAIELERELEIADLDIKEVQEVMREDAIKRFGYWSK